MFWLMLILLFCSVVIFLYLNDIKNIESLFTVFYNSEIGLYLYTNSFTVILTAAILLVIVYITKARRTKKNSIEVIRKGIKDLPFFIKVLIFIIFRTFMQKLLTDKTTSSNNIFSKNTLFIGFVIILSTYILAVSIYFYTSWDALQFYRMFQKLNYFLLPLLLGSTVVGVVLLVKTSRNFLQITPVFLILFVITTIFFKYPIIFLVFSIFAGTFSLFLSLPAFITNFIDTKIFNVKTKEKIILFLHNIGWFQFFRKFFLLIFDKIDNKLFYFFVIWFHVLALFYIIFARFYVYFTYVIPIVWSTMDIVLIFFSLYICLFGFLLRVLTNFSSLLMTITADIRPELLRSGLPNMSSNGGNGHQFNQYNNMFPRPQGPRMNFIRGAGLTMGVCTLGIACYAAYETHKIRVATELAANATARLADQGAVDRGFMTREEYLKRWPSVFDSFLQHEFWHYINTISITVILAALFIFTILYITKIILNKQIFRTSVEEIKDISSIFGMFYTSTIELAGRKGSRIFGLFLTIFFYLAILNLIGLLFVAVTAKSQLSTTFWFSLTIIISFLLLGIRNKGLKFFLMFWNTGVGIGMRILLLFVEVLSFAIRPLSYALRLFANLLSGHILLHLFSKVINLLRKKNKFIPAIVPFVFLCAFGILETLIAVLQSFIPATLAQIWANEIY